MGFQLHAPSWFGWQMLPGYGGLRCAPNFSPIQLRKVTPLKTGKGVIELEFWNALQAPGTQDICVRLKVLHRAENFLVGRVDEGASNEQAAVLSHIEFGWLERCCPELVRTFPPGEQGSLCSGSVQMYLDGVFFQNPPLPLQPRNLDAGNENEWLTACALRFDGYGYSTAHGWENQPYYFCQSLLSGQKVPQSLEEKLTAMFMLQRFLMKEGVKSKSDAGWKRFRELFLELAPQPAPAGYLREGYYADWEQKYVPVLSAGLALLRHLHETARYDEGT